MLNTSEYYSEKFMTMGHSVIMCYVFKEIQKRGKQSLLECP